MRRVLSIAALLTAASFGDSIAEPCNPAIDGTYCRTQGRLSDAERRRKVRIAPIQSIGDDLSIGQDQPGTIGALSFQNGQLCIGLLRRGACN